MNSTSNTTLQPLPSSARGPRTLIISALSAIAGATVALAAVAAWDVYDTNSPTEPSPRASIVIGGGSTSDLTGHVDSDSSVVRGSGVTTDAIQPSARQPRVAPSGRAGHVDSDPSVLFTGGITANVPAYSPSKPIGSSRSGRTGHVDSDPSVHGTVDTPAVPVAPASRTGRGQIFSD